MFCNLADVNVIANCGDRSTNLEGLASPAEVRSKCLLESSGAARPFQAGGGEAGADGRMPGYFRPTRKNDQEYKLMRYVSGRSKRDLSSVVFYL
jgi:hypothetical protein